MRQDFTRVFSATIRGIDPQNHRVTALVNTASVDRHRTIFLPSAFEQALPTYLASNPIFLWGHQQHGQPEDALGIAVAGRATPNGPEVTFEYAVDANPKAARVWDLVAAGVIRAFSIGGYILGAVDRRSPKEELATIPDWARAALDSGEADAVFTDLELVEVSQVLIGSNRDALIKAISDATPLTREMIARALEAGENGENEMEQVGRGATLDEAIEKCFAESTGGVEALRESFGITKTSEAGPVETRMDVRMRGCAARLYNLADCLQLRKWYDESPEDQQQTLRGFLQEMDDVRSIVMTELAAEDGEEEEQEPVEEAAPVSEPGETRTPSLAVAAFAELIRQDPVAALALLEKTFS